MNITLTPEHEELVRQKLQGGRYDTVEELLVQAFQLLEEWDDPDSPLTLAQQQELDRRLDRLEQNPIAGIPWETLKARLLNHPA